MSNNQATLSLIAPSIEGGMRPQGPLARTNSRFCVYFLSVPLFVGFKRAPYKEEVELPSFEVSNLQQVKSTWGFPVGAAGAEAPGRLRAPAGRSTEALGFFAANADGQKFVCVYVYMYKSGRVKEWAYV